MTAKARIVHAVSQSLRRADADTINHVNLAPFKSVTLAGIGQRHPVVYGRDRTSGIWLVRPFVAASKLVFAIEWSYGLCKGVQELYINDANLPGTGVFFEHYNGTPDQTADPTLVAAFASIGETFTDDYANIAYTVFSIDAAAAIAGDPKVSAVFDGRIIFDPRNSASAWTENPALFIEDFTTNTKYGFGLATGGMNASADWCDSLYLGETRCLAGYTVGGQGYTMEDLLDVMCAYAELIWTFDGETILLVPDAPATEQPAIGKGGTVSTEGDLYVNSFDGPGEFRPTGPLDEFEIYLEAESGDVLLETVSPVTKPKYSIDILSDGFTPATLFASSEAGIYMPPPSPANCFTDTAGTTPVSAVGDLVASWRSDVNGLIAIQATSGNRPRYGRHPKGGVRNLLQWSEDLSKPIWTKVTAATVTGTNVINCSPGSNDYIQQEFVCNILAGNKATAKALLSGSGTCSISVSRIQTGSYEGSTYTLTLTSTPTWYEVSHTFAADHVSIGVRIGGFSSGTATAITCDGVQLEYDNSTSHQKVTELWDVTEEDVDDCYGLYFDGSDSLAFASSTGTFKFLHDGSGGELIAAASIGNNKNTGDTGFLAVTASGGSDVGAYLWHSDVPANNEYVQAGIRNGTGSSISDGANDIVDFMVPKVFGMNYEYSGASSNLNLYADGDLKATNSTVFSPSSASATSILQFFSSLAGWCHGIVIIDRILTETERAKVNQYFAVQSGADANATIKVKYTAPTIPDYWIAPWDIEDDSLRMSASGGTSSPTTISINYLPPSGSAAAWVEQPVVVSLPGVYSGDIESIESGVIMHGTFREIEATQKAIARLNRLQFTGQYNWIGFDNAIKLKKGKVAELPSIKGLTRQWVRILDVQMIEPGKHQVVAEHYDEQMHAVDVVSAYPDSPVYVGLIIPYSGTLPVGWADYTAANGKYLIGADGVTIDVGDTGGTTTAPAWAGSTSEDDLHGGIDGNTIPAGFIQVDFGASVETIGIPPVEILHGHAVNIAAFTPDILRRSVKLMIKTDSDGESLPSNAMVFGNDLIYAAGLSRITEFNNRILMAGAATESLGGEIALASKASITAYSTNHNHTGEGGEGHNSEGYSGGSIFNNTGNNSGGPHNHVLAGNLTINLKRFQIAAYGGNVPFSIKHGMVGFWDGALVDIPTDWYLMDGTNGTLTDTTGRNLQIAGGTTLPPAGDNTITFNGKVTPAAHKHGSVHNSDVAPGWTYHDNIYHDHDLDIVIDWVAPYFGIHMIQYLPEELS